MGGYSLAIVGFFEGILDIKGDQKLSFYSLQIDLMLFRPYKLLRVGTCLGYSQSMISQDYLLFQDYAVSRYTWLFLNALWQLDSISYYSLMMSFKLPYFLFRPYIFSLSYFWAYSLPKDTNLDWRGVSEGVMAFQTSKGTSSILQHSICVGNLQLLPNSFFYPISSFSRILLDFTFWKLSSLIRQLNLRSLPSLKVRATTRASEELEQLQFTSDELFSMPLLDYMKQSVSMGISMSISETICLTELILKSS